MKGYQLGSGVCLIVFGLIALQAQFAAAGYSMSETCAYYSEGYIANPDSCKGYGYCSGGALLATGECGGELLFDTATGMCNYANKTQCTSTLTSTCPLITNPVYVADPEDCTKACYCNDGKYTCVSCPAKQVFNPNIRECVYASEYACPANSICRLVPNNEFVGDPEVCGNYLQCLSGAGVSLPCSKGEYYNALKNQCSTVNVCANVPTTAPPVQTGGPGVFDSLADNTTACATNPGTEEPFFVADYQSCMGYYSCDTVGGNGVWFKCPMGTHFNPTLQQCVTPYTFDCQYDRCGNINQTFVSVLGCESYNYCISQTNNPQYGQACKTLNAKFPYFDEYRGACVDQKPVYTICDATPPAAK